jgi:hypothetical protein
LNEIKDDSSTYSSLYQDFVNINQLALLGDPVNIDETHSKIVQPYISTICINISNRLGDAAGNISAAATVFSPNCCKDICHEQQLKHIQQLSKFFSINETDAITEWNMFRSTLLHKKNEHKTAADMFHVLITSDLADSFSCLSTIAQAIVSCPLGTAGNSFFPILLCFACHAFATYHKCISIGTKSGIC